MAELSTQIKTNTISSVFHINVKVSEQWGKTMSKTLEKSVLNTWKYNVKPD